MMDQYADKTITADKMGIATPQPHTDLMSLADQANDIRQLLLEVMYGAKNNLERITGRNLSMPPSTPPLAVQEDALRGSTAAVRDQLNLTHSVVSELRDYLSNLNSI